MAFFGLQKAREQYLERLLMRYGTVTLPLVSTRQALPLQSIFQPMVLRRDPLAPQEKRKTEGIRAKDGAEALTQSPQRRMIVLGGPGMGKTTAQKALLSTAIMTTQLDPSAPFPLFISLPDLMRAALSFEEYTRLVCVDLEIDVRFASILTDAISMGNAFLCLDSLDEVLPALRPDVLAFLNHEAPRCQGTWIIGSRLTEYKGGQFTYSQFTEWELQALGEQERLALARQLLPALSSILYENEKPDLKAGSLLAETYIKALQQSTQIASWGENPLLFSLAAVLYVQTGRIPTSRALLYAQVTEAMFTMRLHDAEQRKELRYLLAEIALEFYQTRGRNFSQTDILEFLPSLVSDQRTQALDAILNLLLDSGVLEPMGYQVYGFKHQMFQEYLAAVALARRCLDETQYQSTWELLWRKRRLSRWTEILRLLVGILVQEHGSAGLQITRTWLSALADEHRTSEGDPGQLCLILVMKSLGELGAHRTEAEVADLVQPFLEQWYRTFVDLYNQAGWQYMDALLEAGSVLSVCNLQIVAPILLSLQQYDQKIQTFCPIPAEPGVINHSLSMKIIWQLFQDIPVSLYDCYTRDALQSPVIRERLIAILEKTDEDWSTEDLAAVVKLLGSLREQTPLALLEKIWRDTARQPDLRISAAEALGETALSVSLDVFVPMLNDLEPAIRNVAIEILGKSKKQEHVDLLFSFLQNPEYQREKALQSLHALGISLPIELLHMLFYDPDMDLSKEAWNCLQEMGELVPLELWLDALQHVYEPVRSHALLALERYRDQLPVEPLLAILAVEKWDEYKERDVRTHCIQALGLLGERAPLEPLLALLHHNDEHLRAHAVSVLTKLHVTLPVEILLPMLDHSRTGSAAAEAIATLGADAPISSLLEMTRSSSSEYTNFASQALRLLYAHVPTEPILELLQDEVIRDDSRGTCWELIQLLQLKGIEISPELLWPALKRLHSQKDIDAVVTPLCQAGAKTPIEPLVRLVYKETHWPPPYPKWIQQLFYVLYEWVLPDHLTHALGNILEDQLLALSLSGLMRDEESIQLIADVERDPDGDCEMRSEAMVILSNLGINLPLEDLIQATRWYTHDGMEAYVADTVQRLGKHTPLEQLLPLLGDEDDQLQSGVVEALVRIVQYIPLETLLPLLEDDNERVRYAAIHILAALRENAPIALFVTLLEDPEQTRKTRCVVLETLGEMGTPVAVEILLEILEDEDAEIRCYALWALNDKKMETGGGLRAFVEQGKEISLATLLRLLDDPDDTIVSNTIKLLGELRSLGLAVPAESLLALVNSEDIFVARDAIWALCKFDERALIDALLAKIYDTDNEQLRSSIFFTVSALENQIPLEILLNTLTDISSQMPEWRVERILAHIMEPRPEEVLKRLHNDPRPTRRMLVLQAIQATRSCEWLPLVLATLQDADGQYTTYDYNHLDKNDEVVHDAAIEALGALNACAPVEPLLQCLHTNIYISMRMISGSLC